MDSKKLYLIRWALVGVVLASAVATGVLIVVDPQQTLSGWGWRWTPLVVFVAAACGIIIIDTHTIRSLPRKSRLHEVADILKWVFFGTAFFPFLATLTVSTPYWLGHPDWQGLWWPMIKAIWWVGLLAIIISSTAYQLVRKRARKEEAQGARGGQGG